MEMHANEPECICILLLQTSTERQSIDHEGRNKGNKMMHRLVYFLVDLS